MLLFTLVSNIIAHERDKMAETNYVIRKSITLYSEDESIVDNFARPKSLDFSTALRLIIREWAQAHPYSEPQFIHNLDVADCPPAE
jgi:hypothetical protein